jgi:hypothetical protein
MPTGTDTCQNDVLPPQYVLSFDVEEHDRIEAAQGLLRPIWQCHEYARRMEVRTRDILTWLASYRQRATFFVVGETAQNHRKLIQEIVAEGHEVAAHGWRHERVDQMDRQQFQEDVNAARKRWRISLGWRYMATVLPVSA